MSKFIVKPPKPRNPLVAAALMRQAGPHGREGHDRRAGREALRRELSTLDLPRSGRGRPPGL